jgi:hypothetical protein
MQPRSCAWFAAVFAVSFAALPAQHRPPPSQDDLKILRATKLARPVFKKAPWTFDYDAAREQARRDNKPVFAYFARSYAHCGRCEALEDGALSEPEFAAFARGVVPFVHVTSRVDGEPQPTLLRDKGFAAFPTLCFLDADGNVLAKTGRTVAAFTADGARVQRLLDLRAKGERATPAEAKECFLTELVMGLVPGDVLAARAAKLPLDDAEKAMVAQKVIDHEVLAILDKAKEAGAEATHAALAAMVAAGRTPSDDVGGTFWIGVLTHASRSRDAALAQRAFAWLDDRYGKDGNYARSRAQWRRLLDDAKRQ